MPTPRRLPVEPAARCPADAVAIHFPAAGAFPVAAVLMVAVSKGRATYTMQFDAYPQVPESIASEIIKRVRGE